MYDGFDAFIASLEANERTLDDAECDGDGKAERNDAGTEAMDKLNTIGYDWCTTANTHHEFAGELNPSSLQTLRIVGHRTLNCPSAAIESFPI